jgi:hypothetical protein
MRIYCEILPAKVLLKRLNHGELPIRVALDDIRYNRARAVDILAQDVLGRRLN